MPETCSVESFKKWQHDGLAFLEANVWWSQASRVFHEIRKSASEVDVKIYQQVLLGVNHAVETDGGSGKFRPDFVAPLL